MADHRRPPRPIYSALLCHVTCPVHPIRGGAGRDVRTTNAARNRGYWERAPAVPSGGWGTRGGASSSPRARWSRSCGAPLGHSHEPRGSQPPPDFRLCCSWIKLPGLRRHYTRARAAAAVASGQSETCTLASMSGASQTKEPESRSQGHRAVDDPTGTPRCPSRPGCRIEPAQFAQLLFSRLSPKPRARQMRLGEAVWEEKKKNKTNGHRDRIPSGGEEDSG